MSSIRLSVFAAGQTGIQIQNLDQSEAMTWIADFHRRAGGPPAFVMGAQVLSGAAANVYLPGQAALRADDYGVILSADRLLGAVAHRTWPGAARAVAFGAGHPGTEIAVPLVMRSFAGQSSRIVLHNTDTGLEVNLTLELFQQDGTAVGQGETRRIPPGTVDVVDLAPGGDFRRVPVGFLGWMRVRAVAPISVHALVSFDENPDVAYAFEGLPTEMASERSFAPVVRSDFHGTTGLAILNPVDAPADVAVTYHPSATVSACAGKPEIQHGPIKLPPRGGVVLYHGDPDPRRNPLPRGCLASAVIATSTRVLAVVNDASGLPATTSAAYTAIPNVMLPPARAGAPRFRAGVPLVRNRHTAALLSSGVQVMNVGDRTAAVEIEFVDARGHPVGCGAACAARVDPDGAHVFYLPSLSALPAGSYGSAIVRSDQPVVVVASEASESGRADATMYSGVPIDDLPGPGIP